MKITRRHLRRLINEEITILSEHDGHHGDHASVDQRFRWYLDVTSRIASKRGSAIEGEIQGLRRDVAELLGDLERHLPGHSPAYDHLMNLVLRNDDFPILSSLFADEISVQNDNTDVANTSYSVDDVVFHDVDLSDIDVEELEGKTGAAQTREIP